MSNFFIHNSSFVNDKAIIGEGTKIWHFCHVMEATIGKNCSFGQNVFIANNVVIGDNVKVQNNVSLYDGVVVEDDVFLGPSMVFTNVINPRSFVSRKSEYKKTLIKKGATIGANATLVCGNSIGTYAFIAAGAVVTKPVEDYALVMGNPAVQKGWMSKNGQHLIFDKNGKATCPESGEMYNLDNENKVSQINDYA